MQDNERRAMWRRIFALERRMSDAEGAIGTDDDDDCKSMPLVVTPPVEKRVPSPQSVIDDMRSIVSDSSYHPNPLTWVLIKKFVKRHPDVASRRLRSILEKGKI